MSDLSSNLLSDLVIQLTPDTLLSTLKSQTTLVLLCDCTHPSSIWFCRMLNVVAGLSDYEKLPVTVALYDASVNPLLVQHFTDRLPTLLLSLGGFPIVYTGMFRVGDIHIWLKAQLYTSCCPVTP
jgi:hypothetical protein